METLFTSIINGDSGDLCRCEFRFEKSLCWSCEPKQTKKPSKSKLAILLTFLLINIWLNNGAGTSIAL